MEDKPNNPEAFPADTVKEDYSGMTLRDYFAAKAITGAIFKNANAGSQSELAKRAYEIADAMLNQRER